LNTNKTAFFFILNRRTLTMLTKTWDEVVAGAFDDTRATQQKPLAARQLGLSARQLGLSARQLGLSARQLSLSARQLSLSARQLTLSTRTVHAAAV
jgi:hypothetical protein